MLAFYPRDDPIRNLHARENITLALWLGLAPSAFLGAALSWLRTRYFLDVIMGKFRYVLACAILRYALPYAPVCVPCQLQRILTLVPRPTAQDESMGAYGTALACLTVYSG